MDVLILFSLIFVPMIVIAIMDHIENGEFYRKLDEKDRKRNE